MSLRSVAAAAITAVVAAALALGSVPAAHAGPADAPTAPKTYTSTPYGTSVQGNLCAGATDPQGGPISIATAAGYSDGDLVYDAQTCDFTYTPAPGVSGQRSVRYKLTDGTNVSDWIYHIVIIGVPGNAPIDAQPDAFETGKNLALVLPDLHAQLTANDTDPEGQPMTIVQESAVVFLPGETLEGLTGLGPDAMVYYPPTGFVGTRRIEYRVSDGTNTSWQEWTITVTDKGPQQAPVAVGNSYTVPKGGSLTVTAANGLLANDSDADSAFFRVGGPVTAQHGTVTNLDTWAGTFTYTPSPGYTGTDSFTYFLVDSEGNTSNPATVTLNVKTLPPAAVDDNYQVAQGGQLVVPAPGLVANDSDADSSFTVTSALPPLHGTLSVTHATGAFVYTPTPGWSGTDQFGYRLVDPDGNYSTWATVTVTVVPPGVNQPPVAHDDGYQVRQGQTLTVAAGDGPLANDTDFEGSDLDVDEVLPPAHGTFTAFDEETGAFTYQPAAGWHGTETVTYKAIDAKGALDTGVLTIEVFNDAPIAHADSYSAVPGVPLVVTAAQGVLANDTDPEGEQLHATNWSLPLHGDLFPSKGGGFTYAPDSGFTGVETITYTVRDEAWQPSEPATLTITVATGQLATARPVIKGTARVRRTFRARAGAWGPGAVAKTYRWFRNGKAIRGATRASYRLVRADRGKRITVRVTGSKPGYATASRTSAARRVR